MKTTLAASMSVLIGLVITLSTSADAHASLIGQTITCSSSNPGPVPCSAPSNVVGGGVEFLIGRPDRGIGFHVDVGGQSVTVASILPDVTQRIGSNTITLGGLIWSDDPLAVILGIANFAAAGVIGASPGMVQTLPNSLIFDLGGTTEATWTVGSSVSFDLVTSHPPSTTIPEPGTLALFSLGLAGFGYVARRRTAAQTLRQASS